MSYDKNHRKTHDNVGLLQQHDFLTNVFSKLFDR